MFKRGYKQTDEHKRKIRDAQIGVPRPSITGELNPAKRQDVRDKMSRASKGKKKSSEHIEKLKLINVGRKASEGTKRKMKMSAPRGENSHLWKGGISKLPKYRSFMARKYIIRKRGNGGFHTLDEWETLKAQYDWTCPCCHKSEPEIILTEDHIVPLIKGGSNNIENIQPLCKSCNCKKATQTITYLKPT